MPVTLDFQDQTFTASFDGVVRARFDDLSLTAWGERHSLAAGGLSAGPADQSASQDEVGTYEGWDFPFATRSVRNAVSFRLAARCYDLEPALLLELVPAFSQPVLGTEEAATLRLAELPGCAEGVLLHQRVNEFGRDATGAWWAQAWFGADPTRGHRWDWGLLSGWRYDDGACGVLFPLRAGGAVARLRGEGDGLSLVAAGWCGRHHYPRLPLALLVIDESPQAAIDRAFRAAEGLCQWSFRLREGKIYPTAFDYLGYTTWGGLGRQLTVDAAVAALDSLREAAIPVRWMCLDEGWQQVNAHQQLHGFDAATDRFPDGLHLTINRLQSAGGLRHVGVWTTLQGAWGGLDPQSAIAPAGQVWRGLDGTTIPQPAPAGQDLWRGYYNELLNAGVDFVKVDNQGSTRNLYLGQLALDEAAGAAVNHVETAAAAGGLDLVAGMALHPECYLHFARTNVMRVSADLVDGDRRAAKLHLTHSVHVGAWFGRLAWPDYDAFASTHLAARAVAAFTALSGGPVCLTDVPGRHDPELARRLCLADGRLLLPDRPAEPPAAFHFADPLVGRVPLVAVAPAGRVPRQDPSVGLNEWRARPAAWLAAVANVGLDGTPLTVSLTPRELDAPAAERYAVNGHFSGRQWLVGADEAVTFELGELEAEVLTLVPLDAGRAVVGLTAKLLGACGCAWDADDVVSVPEPGLVLLSDDGDRVPQTIDYEPLPLVADRPPVSGEAQRAGAWVWVHTASTVFRMEHPR